MVNLECLRQYASCDEANVDRGTTFKKPPEGTQARTQIQTPSGAFPQHRDCCTELGQVVPDVDPTRTHGTKGLQN